MEENILTIDQVISWANKESTKKKLSCKYYSDLFWKYTFYSFLFLMIFLIIYDTTTYLKTYPLITLSFLLFIAIPPFFGMMLSSYYKWVLKPLNKRQLVSLVLIRIDNINKEPEKDEKELLKWLKYFNTHLIRAPENLEDYQEIFQDQVNLMKTFIEDLYDIPKRIYALIVCKKLKEESTKKLTELAFYIYNHDPKMFELLQEISKENIEKEELPTFSQKIEEYHKRTKTYFNNKTVRLFALIIMLIIMSLFVYFRLGIGKDMVYGGFTTLLATILVYYFKD